MRLAFLSHTAMGGPFRVGSHHLATALARGRHEIVHVSAPVSLAHLGGLHDAFIRTRLRRWWRGGEYLGGVRDVVPMTWLPWRLARGLATLRGWYSRAMLVSPTAGVASLRLPSFDGVIIDEPRFAGLAISLAGCRLIYRATDLYAAMRDDAWVDQAERLICAHADVLVATSEPVAAHLRRLSGRTVHVIPNGVEFEHFCRSSDSIGTDADVSLPGDRADRAVYMGAFDARFGLAGFAAAVSALPRKQFILIGPGGQAIAAGLAAPNVIALGAVPYARLPQILQQCSVGLLPMSSAAANSGRSPMKLYEYAAAGLAVAATSTAELRSRDLATLCLASSAAAFPDAVAEAFARSANPSLVEAARSTAREQGWGIKASLLLSLFMGVPSATQRTAEERARDATVHCTPLTTSSLAP